MKFGAYFCKICPKISGKFELNFDLARARFRALNFRVQILKTMFSRKFDVIFRSFFGCALFVKFRSRVLLAIFGRIYNSPHGYLSTKFSPKRLKIGQIYAADGGLI